MGPDLADPAAVGHCRTVTDELISQRVAVPASVGLVHLRLQKLNFLELACCRWQAGRRIGAGGVITCAVPCLTPCRSGRRRATTGTASSATCRATSCRATTASGSTTSSACRTSSSPETEAPTGSVSSAGYEISPAAVRTAHYSFLQLFLAGLSAARGCGF